MVSPLLTRNDKSFLNFIQIFVKPFPAAEEFLIHEDCFISKNKSVEVG
jgi:hypothetical protein